MCLRPQQIRHRPVVLVMAMVGWAHVQSIAEVFCNYSQSRRYVVRHMRMHVEPYRRAHRTGNMQSALAHPDEAMCEFSMCISCCQKPGRDAKDERPSSQRWYRAYYMHVHVYIDVVDPCLLPAMAGGQRFIYIYKIDQNGCSRLMIAEPGLRDVDGEFRLATDHETGLYACRARGGHG